jgi:hypothetical protein
MKVLGRDRKALQTFDSETIDQVCPVLRMTPLAAACYAHWKRGIAHLLELGATSCPDVSDARLFALVGAQDRPRQRQPLASCAEVLHIVGNIQNYPRHRLIHMPVPLLEGVAGKADRFGFIDVASKLIEATRRRSASR